MGGSSCDGQDPDCRLRGPPQDQLYPTDTIRLLERAKDGDDQALEEVCSRYLPQLRRWATGRLSPRMRGMVETGDLVQEVLLATIRRLEDLRPRHPSTLR